MRRIACLVLAGALWIIGAAVPALAQTGCAQSEAASSGAEVAAARARLTRIAVGEMQTDVTPDAQAAIEALKDRIVLFATAVLGCADAPVAPAAIQARLAALGDSFEGRTLHTADNPGRDMHGDGLAYAVARPPGHPDLLAIVASVSIECGDDSVLILFERSGGGWRPLMIRRSAPYREISGAFGSFAYALSPPDRDGAWYLATTRITPWCTSMWQAMDYDLSRPGADPAQPRIFFSRRVGTYLGNDRPDDLRAEPGRFQVRHDGGMIDVGILVRRHVDTYAVDGARVRRIQPAAFNVRDFVDEWISAAWAEAAAWSSSAPALAQAHRRLAAPNDGSTLISFEDIRKCGAGLHMVEVDVEREAPWYFVVRGDGSYRLENVSRTPSRACRGPDISGRMASRGDP